MRGSEAQREMICVFVAIRSLKGQHADIPCIFMEAVCAGESCLLEMLEYFMLCKLSKKKSRCT